MMYQLFECICQRTDDAVFLVTEVSVARHGTTEIDPVVAAFAVRL